MYFSKSMPFASPTLRHSPASTLRGTQFSIGVPTTDTHANPSCGGRPPAATIRSVRASAKYQHAAQTSSSGCVCSLLLCTISRGANQGRSDVGSGSMLVHRLPLRARGERSVRQMRPPSARGVTPSGAAGVRREPYVVVPALSHGVQRPVARKGVPKWKPHVTLPAAQPHVAKGQVSQHRIIAATSLDQGGDKRVAPGTARHWRQEGGEGVLGAVPRGDLVRHRGRHVPHFLVPAPQRQHHLVVHEHVLAHAKLARDMSSGGRLLEDHVVRICAVEADLDI